MRNPGTGPTDLLEGSEWLDPLEQQVLLRGAPVPAGAD